MYQTNAGAKIGEKDGSYKQTSSRTSKVDQIRRLCSGQPSGPETNITTKSSEIIHLNLAPSDLSSNQEPVSGLELSFRN